MEIAKQTILKLQQECEQLRQQLQIYQPSGDDQLQGNTEIDLDQLVSDDIDNNLDDTKIGSSDGNTIKWLATTSSASSSPSITTTQLIGNQTDGHRCTFELTDLNVDIIEKCEDVIYSNEYLAMKNDTAIETSIECVNDNATEAAKFISTITDGEFIERKPNEGMVDLCGGWGVIRGGSDS